MNNQHTPAMTDKQLYASVKAAFISKHTSLNKWCVSNGIHRQNARKVLLGEWKGDGAEKLRTRLIIESGLDVTLVMQEGRDDLLA